jgi:hypothetical protein
MKSLQLRIIETPHRRKSITNQPNNNSAPVSNLYITVWGAQHHHTSPLLIKISHTPKIKQQKWLVT